MLASASERNLAKAPDAIMSSAISEVIYLFQASRVEVTWTPCTDMEMPDPDAVDTCFVVRIRDTAPQGVGGLHELMGRAYLGPGIPRLSAGAYQYVDVYYPAAAKLARSRPDSEAGRILGCVIAHEVGHQILGAQHTAGSVMAADWGSNQVELIRKRAFRFGKHDRDLITTQLRDLRLQESLLAQDRRC
jgi:hypothetical protein